MTGENSGLSVAEFLKGAEIGKFVPHASIFESLQMFHYIERDVSYTTVPIPGSNISLLYSNKPGEECTAPSPAPAPTTPRLSSRAALLAPHTAGLFI